MIQFYKPNKKVTGTACSFWMNKDGSIMASLIKQDGWNDKTHIGSFAKNKENPNGRVVVKLGNTEVAAIIDVLETSKEWSTYHQSSKQKLQIKFGAYNRNSEQVGYSFSVNKQDVEDSTNKVGFIIGFTFPEGRYLKQYLSFLLNDWFKNNEQKYDQQNNKQNNEQKYDQQNNKQNNKQSYQPAAKEEDQVEHESSDLSEGGEDFEW